MYENHYITMYVGDKLRWHEVYLYSRIYNSYYEIPKNDMSSFHFKVNIQDKSCFNSHIKAYLQNEM